VVSRQNADMRLKDVATATFFLAFYMWAAHWRHLANTTEPSVCGGDAALCQITLTARYCYYKLVRSYTYKHTEIISLQNDKDNENNSSLPK